MIVRTLGTAMVVFTDRHGGVSRGPYESANLAYHVGDEPDAVAENRALAAARAGMGRPDQWACVHQVHGNGVVRFDAPPGSGTEPAFRSGTEPAFRSGTEPAFRSGTEPDADASVTTAIGLPLVILTADCAPLAIVGDGAVAAVHVGWAGLEAGVVERAANAVRAVAPGPLRAVLGPCIHPGRYEFGPGLLERLVTRFGVEIAALTEADRPALDIPAAVRIALRNAGVDALDDVGVCTASSPDYFSYRRDGDTGRQAMLVVRER
ncbi:MAG: polyphenol oxidase family protein [Acidimicrobiia bacterium]